MKRAFLFLIVGALFISNSAANPAATATERATVPALNVRYAESVPVIDGDLSDECWREAALVPNFKPAIGAAGSDTNLQETTVRVLWTEEFLYVAFDCVDADVYFSGTLKHDDNIYTEDVAEIFLDGAGDGRQFAEIQIAPDGTNLDMMYVFTSAIETAPDGRIAESILRRERWGFREWEMNGLKTAAGKTPGGWSAEAAIPAKDIVKRSGEKTFMPGMKIRAQFVRYDHVPAEDGSDERRIVQQTWSPVMHGNPHNSPLLFGELILAKPCGE